MMEKYDLSGVRAGHQQPALSEGMVGYMGESGGLAVVSLSGTPSGGSACR